MAQKNIYTKRTKEVMDFVDANYPNMSIEKMANNFGVSVTVIKNYMKEKGYPTTLFRYTTTFKKGQIPFNKGMKMNPHPNSIATQFKKGQSPKNEKSIGSIRTRSSKQGNLKFIKIGEKKWMLYSKYIWQEHNGKIPLGKVVFHKDGNSENCEIENLELITREELAVRNSGSQNFSDSFVLKTISRNKQEKDTIRNKYPDLIKLKRSILQIKRQTNAKKRTSND